MTEQRENTVLRELSDDELRVVSGARPIAPMPKACTYELGNKCYVWGYGGVGAIALYYAERTLEMLRGK